MNLLTHTKPKSLCPSLSLPAGIDCPASPVSVRLARASGRFAICANCYARRGRYAFRKVRQNQLARSAWWHATDPLERAAVLANAVRGRNTVRYFRCYDSGDLDPTAVDTWLKFAELLPETIIWIPTRTWLLPAFLPRLRALNAHQRIVVRPSAVAFDDPPPAVNGLAGGHAAHRHEPPKASYLCSGSCRNCRICWERPDLSTSFKAR